MNNWNSKQIEIQIKRNQRWFLCLVSRRKQKYVQRQYTHQCTHVRTDSGVVCNLNPVREIFEPFIVIITLHAWKPDKKVMIEKAGWVHIDVLLCKYKYINTTAHTLAQFCDQLPRKFSPYYAVTGVSRILLWNGRCTYTKIGRFRIPTRTVKTPLCYTVSQLCAFFRPGTVTQNTLLVRPPKLRWRDSGKGGGQGKGKGKGKGRGEACIWRQDACLLIRQL